MIAQFDIEQINSRVEMLFHRMKHRYLYTILGSNCESLVKGTDFYLSKSNTCIPQSALQRQLRKKSYPVSGLKRILLNLKRKLRLQDS